MNLQLLRDGIEERKINITALADKMGVTRATLYNKLEGKTPITIPEMNVIRKEMRLTEDEVKAIFWPD